MATDSRYLLPPHIRLLNRLLLDLAAGRILRLIVTLPPRHGKSELISHWLPTWFLGLWPDRSVILASYEASFAAWWGRKVARSLHEFGPAIFGFRPLNDNPTALVTHSSGGGLHTAGAGGPITGKGADLFVIDDPVKNAEEAVSAVYREKIWEWFQSVAYTRLEPGGKMVIIMTRWHEDDLVGRLLRERPSEWTVVRIPAISEGAGDPLNRPAGEPLWPARFDRAKLDSIRQTIGTRWFDAMYQQAPRPGAGGIISRDMFTIMDRPPDSVQSKIRYWDFAATPEQFGGRVMGAAYTAGVLLALMHDGRYIVLDVKRQRADPAEVERMVRMTAEADGYDVPIRIEEEPGSSGIALMNHYARNVLRGYVFRPDRVTGPKDVRAAPLLAAIENRQVVLLKAPWNEEFIREFEAYPAGVYRDQIDATAGAFNSLRPDHPALRSLLPRPSIPLYTDAMPREQDPLEGLR